MEQLSVFLENNPGRLADMSRVLGSGGHNMRVLMVADTAEYGVARLVVDRPHEAKRLLEANGFAVTITPVIAVAVPDRPGGLGEVLEALGGAGVNVEYAYAFVKPGGAYAVDVFRVEDPDKACAALERAGIDVVAASELYQVD